MIYHAALFVCIMKNPMVSIDFWNTLVCHRSNGVNRTQARIRGLRSIARIYDKNPTEEQIQQARQAVSQAFDVEWLGNHRTLTTEELVRGMLAHLNIPAREKHIEELTATFQESLFEGPPEPAPGIKEALEELSRYYRIGLISDTMFSPGTMLRKYLDQIDLLQYFDAFAFSDELGVSKPHPKPYRHVLQSTNSDPALSWHVGDIHQTDIIGAKNMGMGAILYVGLNSADRENTTADFVNEQWEAVADILVSERK